MKNGVGKKTLFTPEQARDIYIQAISKLKHRDQFEGGLHENRKGKEKKGKKVKRGWRETKKWIRVFKGKIILSLFCFPVFGYVP